MNIKNIEENRDRAVEILKAISNEKRLVIFCALYEGEKSVSALERIVGLSQSALSQHLARLRRDNVVKTRRSAQTIYYSISSNKVLKLIENLDNIFS